MNSNIQKAINTAAILHHNQWRKGEKIPYITHPYNVAFILMKYTTDEAVLSAALLHDTLEDCDYTAERLRSDFGDKVMKIVMEVTENIALKKEQGSKDSWQARKQQYLEHLKNASNEALMVCAADKIHNLQSMVTVYKKEGDVMWDKFNSAPDKQVWFYEEVFVIIRTRLNTDIVSEYEEVLNDAKKSFRGGVEQL